MSAFSEYIHLTKKEYQQKTQSSLATALQAQKNRNQERINNLSDINEDILRELQNRVQNESNQNQARSYVKSQQHQNDTLTNFQNKVIDFLETMLSDSPVSTIHGRKISKTSKITMANVNIEELIRLRKALYDRINRINKNIQQGNGVTPLVLKNLNRDFNNFISALGIANKRLDFNINEADLKKADSLTNLKNLLNSISLTEAYQATFNGQFGETLVAISDDIAKNIAQKSVKNMVSSNIKGQDRTSFQVTEQQVDKKVATFYQEKTKNNLYQIRASQDKVDVSIQVNNVEIDASVKAYTPRGNIIIAHLQDIDLFYSLLSTVENFSQHWLNLHCLDIPNKDMDSAFEEQLKYEALVSGNLLKKGALQANVFVAIDVQNGRVYTQSTKNILKNDAMFRFSPPLSSLSYAHANKKMNTIEERIANIIIAIRKEKIAVALKAPLEVKNLTS